MRRYVEVEMQVRSVELSQRLSHSEQLSAREQKAHKEERDKFEALQEQLAHRAADQEGEARKRHEELMSRLILEREKQLLELDTAWRKKAARAEMAGLQNEAAAYRKAMAEREAAYTAREREYLLKIEELRKEAAAEAVRGDNPLMPPSSGAAPPSSKPPSGPSGFTHSSAVTDSVAEVSKLVESMPSMPRDSRSSAGGGAAFSDSTGMGAGDGDSPLSDSPLSGASPDGSNSKSPDGSSRLTSETGTPSRTFETTMRTAFTDSTPGGATFSTEDSGTGDGSTDANDLTLSPRKGV